MCCEKRVTFAECCVNSRDSFAKHFSRPSAAAFCPVGHLALQTISSLEALLLLGPPPVFFPFPIPFFYLTVPVKAERKLHKQHPFFYFTVPAKAVRKLHK